jgi:hypothetical protein
MTRINVGVAPTELCDQHLMAEYRELPRMIGYARRHTRDCAPIRPFTLGTGHMNCMLPFGSYLHQRYDELVRELRWRDYSINPQPFVWPIKSYVIEDSFFEAARPIVQQRLIAKLPLCARWTLCLRPDWYL